MTENYRHAWQFAEKPEDDCAQVRPVNVKPRGPVKFRRAGRFAKLYVAVLALLVAFSVLNRLSDKPAPQPVDCSSSLDRETFRSNCRTSSEYRAEVERTIEIWRGICKESPEMCEYPSPEPPG
jgi:hypothetical protein